MKQAPLVNAKLTKLELKEFKFLKFFAGQSGRAERFAETSAKRLSTYGAHEGAAPPLPCRGGAGVGSVISCL